MHAGHLAIGTTFALQSVTALAWMALPVLAPYVALSAGVEPSRVGGMAGVMFATALVANIVAAQLLTIIGALRTIQFGACIAALGLLLAQFGSWPMIITSALVIGVGYGLGVPAASQILARHTDATSRGLVFSIKQSGVPVGGLVAGAVLPVIAVATDWRWAVVAAAAVCLAVAAAVETARSRLDDLSTPGRRAPWRSVRFRFPLLGVMRVHEDLRWLTYCGFAAAAMQGTTFALLVALLVATGRFEPVAAGLVFATMHASGAASRIVLGITSDRFLAPQPLLALLALLGACAIMTLALGAADLALPAIFALAAVIGTTVSGWNGVYLAEIANLSPPAQVGEITAGSVALVFLGYIIGPLLASFIVELSGSYAMAFGLLALFLVVGPLIFVSRVVRNKAQISRRRSDA